MNKNRYHFYKADDKTICVTHYHGESVRATSTRHPEDVYNEEVGKEIAKAKVDVKVSNKKLKYIAEQKNLIADVLIKLKQKYADYLDYEKEIRDHLREEEILLNNLLKK